MRLQQLGSLRCRPEIWLSLAEGSQLETSWEEEEHRSPRRTEPSQHTCGFISGSTWPTKGVPIPQERTFTNSSPHSRSWTSLGFLCSKCLSPSPNKFVFKGPTQRQTTRLNPSTIHSPHLHLSGFYWNTIYSSLPTPSTSIINTNLYFLSTFYVPGLM